ncbi:MAG: rhodanese-like domain-containing protein [Paracoccaceae bacterium]
MTVRVNRRFVIGAAVAAATGAGWVLFRPRAVFAGENIDAPSAHARAVAGEIMLIDIRRPDEWQATGVGSGAQPLDMRADDFSDALLSLVGGNAAAPIALICARGVRSARLSARLTAAGFGHVINVPEGMLGSADGPGWIARGLPVRQV